jgi:hypothetical protein
MADDFRRESATVIQRFRSTHAASQATISLT